MKIQFHRIDTNVVVGLLVREFCCSGTDVSAKVLAMYAGTRTPPMEPQWLATGLSQSESVLLRNNAWYYATDEAKQSYKKERNQERNERRRQARKCEVTKCENEKLPACHYCEEHKCIKSGCDSLKDAGSEYCALHRPSKKTRRCSSQKENYEYEDADDFYYDHIDEYENYDDAQDDWGDY